MVLEVSEFLLSCLIHLWSANGVRNGLRSNIAVRTGRRRCVESIWKMEPAGLGYMETMEQPAHEGDKEYMDHMDHMDHMDRLERREHKETPFRFVFAINWQQGGGGGQGGGQGLQHLGLQQGGNQAGSWWHTDGRTHLNGPQQHFRGLISRRGGLQLGMKGRHFRFGTGPHTAIGQQKQHCIGLHTGSGGGQGITGQGHGLYLMNFSLPHGLHGISALPGRQHGFGLQQGCGLQHGMQQGCGLQQGMQQGCGLQQGMQQGCGLQRGLQQGLQRGMQQSIVSFFTEPCYPNVCCVPITLCPCGPSSCPCPILPVPCVPQAAVLRPVVRPAVPVRYCTPLKKDQIPRHWPSRPPEKPAHPCGEPVDIKRRPIRPPAVAPFGKICPGFRMQSGEIIPTQVP
ncbi:unnamed protein product [Phyllotreta striolata]|uniref:Uncharacterized protein n=1 Tax=Phyllotreta striolata TaxID=444603 RepID=A0A9N9TTJ2_PHYSR|nr:unnamed protein product [Phyllotreta striolata]